MNFSISLIFNRIPPSANKLIRLSERHWQAYNREKKFWNKLAKETWLVTSGVPWKFYTGDFKIPPLKIFIKVWHKDKRSVQDVDNLIFAVGKLIIDGLVAGDILAEDTPKYIESYEVEQLIGKPERTEITISPAGD